MADEDRWVWDERLGRYRNERTGRLLPAARIQAMRDRLLESVAVAVGALANRLSHGNLTVGTWERQMRGMIKSVFGAQYVFGRGGLNAMQPADWARVGDLVKVQNGYLKGFADDIANGKLSQPQITIRAQMYVGSSVQAHEAGKAAALAVELPAMPGDGSAPCLSNDRCAWHLRQRKDGRVEATWVADLDERTCKTCRKRAEDWNPLILVPGARAPKVEPSSGRLRTPSKQVVEVS